MANMITFFALASDGSGVVSFEVEGTDRSAVAPALRASAGHSGRCWRVDMATPATPSWVCSWAGGEASAEPHNVLEPVREAGALWWAAWAGRDCAREWHEQGPWPIEPGTEYTSWASQQEGLPAPGDDDFLADGLRPLTDREPTEAEQEAFRKALLERLWDISPVEEAA